MATGSNAARLGSATFARRGTLDLMAYVTRSSIQWSVTLAAQWEDAQRVLTIVKDMSGISIELESARIQPENPRLAKGPMVWSGQNSVDGYNITVRVHSQSPAAGTHLWCQFEDALSGIGISLER